jgi:hypothetical protein
MQTYENSQLLQRVIIRVPKQDSSFCYFILESNGGVAFYSTLETSLKKQYRDILIHSPIELKSNLEDILEHLEKSVDLTLIESETIKDEL